MNEFDETTCENLNPAKFRQRVDGKVGKQ